MKIYCPNCSEVSELPFVPQEGQHLLCPFCDQKFSYSIRMSLSRYANKAKVDAETDSGVSEVDEKPSINSTQTKKTPRTLIKCMDCGHFISKRAKSCPNCGAPMVDIEQEEDNENTKEFEIRHNLWIARIMYVLKCWVDAYKRIFDFSGSSDRMQLLSFLGVQFIVYRVFSYLVGEFIITSSWIISPIIILGTYAMFSLGLRRLNDIGMSKKWACVLGLIFVIGYVCDVINSDGIISPLFLSVYRIDEYLYVLLICISWVKSGDVQNQKVCRNYFLPIVGLIVYVLLFCHAGASLTRTLDKFQRTTKKEVEQRKARDMPYRNMSYNVYSRDDASSTYIINTDGPANAQIFVVYVMGRLHSTNLIKCSNQDAANKVLKQINENFELEGAFLSNFR